MNEEMARWDDGIPDEQWLDAIERKRAYRCKLCGRRNIGTEYCDGIPCLDFNCKGRYCKGRYGPVVTAIEGVA